MFTNTHSLKQVANFTLRPHSPSWRRYSDVLLHIVSKDCKRIYSKGFTKKLGVLQIKHIGTYSKHQETWLQDFCLDAQISNQECAGRCVTTNSLER